MKTPYAILIGLALIAAALFFRQPSVAPAQAGLIGGVDGFECTDLGCAVLHGDQITLIRYSYLRPNSGIRRNESGTGTTTPWR
jgi:hypothetical protein